MKQICLILITTLFLFGCKKDHNKDIESSTFGTAQNIFANKIVLNEVKVAGDSAKVSWSKLDTSAFVSYILLRKDYTYLPMVAVKQLSKKDQITTTDYSLPFSPIIQYQVEGHLASGKTITSNVITCLRPDFTLPTVTSFDVKYNSLDQTLYFTENNGNISVYSLIKKTVIKSINTHAKIGYCDFGTYLEGKNCMYQQITDGFIYMMPRH